MPSLTSAISFRVNSYQFFLSDKFVLFYLFASFLPGFLLKAFMSQSKDFCGHFKALWDNHPSCANNVFIVPGKTPARFVVPGL